MPPIENSTSSGEAVHDLWYVLAYARLRLRRRDDDVAHRAGRPGPRLALLSGTALPTATSVAGAAGGRSRQSALRLLRTHAYRTDLGGDRTRDAFRMFWSRSTWPMPGADSSMFVSRAGADIDRGITASWPRGRRDQRLVLVEARDGDRRSRALGGRVRRHELLLSVAFH